MTDNESEVLWEGANALAPLLVRITDLEPFPGNPRRGDIQAIAASLKRFGQVKPIVVDGKRIVAGHHLVLAAIEIGWTHVSAVTNDFRDEDEQRAYLLADNRTSELGSVQTDLLVAHLRTLREIDALEGTGYTDDDVDAYMAELARQIDEPILNRTDEPREKSDLTEVVLIYSAEQRADLEQWLKIVSKEKSTEGPSETVYAAVRMAALAVNQGDDDRS